MAFSRTSQPVLGNFDRLDLSNPSEMGLNWQKWRDAFYLFLQVNEVTDPIKKKLFLLHYGGIELQSIFNNLPDIDPNVSAFNDIFKIAIDKLNNYFLPKKCRTYERLKFRGISQGEDNFDEFLLKLRTQASKCELKGEAFELYMIDQIVEKCKSEEMRKRLLEKERSLDEVIRTAKAFELSSQQSKLYKSNEPSSSINIVTKDVTCYKCGKQGHLSSSDQCPAKSRFCKNCSQKGHFAIMCKQKKRAYHQDKKEKSSGKKVKGDSVKLLSLDEKKNDDFYMFHLDDLSTSADMEIKIGGVKVKIMIDSGASCNVIDEGTWSNMKSQKVKVINAEKAVTKTIKAYASDTPLKIIGAFTADIEVANKVCVATFYVIKNGNRSLLGRKTALELGVLRIGLDVHNITEVKPFPKIKGFLLEIPIDSKVTPINQPYRRIPMPLTDLVEKKLDKLLQLDIIEPVNEASRWVSPMVPILKGENDVRICLDMRRVNEAILRVNHPLPTIDDLLPELQDCSYFSKLDIENAFHQFELHPKCRYITTFITSKGLFRYKRLLFGLSCAPEIFQHALAQILSPCTGAFNYIDDILVYGKTQEEHDERLDKVKKTLEAYGVLLNKNKCVYRVKQIEFLGVLLTQEGVKPSPRKVEALKNFRDPKSCEELRSFLGFVTYCSKFIPDYSTLSEPLWEVVRGNKFVWNTKQKECFDNLKKQLSDESKLGYYDRKDKTRVIADASPTGLGAVLVQFKNDDPRVVYYASKNLSPVERRYCQTEKEALALVWAVERLRVFLYGMRFQLVTDHKALQAIFKKDSKPCPRIERWVLRLQSFKFDLVYCEGKKNIADSFSRLYDPEIPAEPFDMDMEDFVHAIVKFATPMAVSLITIKKHSLEDQVIQKIIKGIYQDEWDKDILHYKVFETEFSVHEGILLRSTKIVIPEKLQEEMLKLSHEGHPGVTKMKLRLRQKVWWYKMDKMVENYVKNCRGCILTSAPANPVPLCRRELPKEALDDLAIDFLGPLPSGHYWFIVVDYYSRYQEIFVMTKITASETILRMKEWIARLGVPRSMTADNGRTFVGEEFKAFCEEFGIILINTIPYWPAMNGEVERQNRAVLKRLIISQNLLNDWKAELNEYLLMYHTTPHISTGKSPHELMFKKLGRDKLPMIQNHLGLDEETREHDKISKEKGRKYADEKRKAKISELKVGDIVLTKNLHKQNKLSPNFSNEEFKVVKISGGDVHIRDGNGKEFRRYAGHLKKIMPNEEETNEEDMNEDDSNGEDINEEIIEQPGKAATKRKREDGFEGEKELLQDSEPRAKRTKKIPSKYNDYNIYEM